MCIRDRVKKDLFPELNALHPDRVMNQTNGVTPRRWLKMSNRPLSSLITKTIGAGWEDDLDRLKGLETVSYTHLDVYKRQVQGGDSMNIAQAAAASGLPSKTIRYYEEIGLVRPQRGDNGYRRFDGKSLHKLTFLARARSLGFSIEECRALLALYEDQGRTSAEVKALTVAHLAQVRAKIAELHEMENVLSRLIESCAGDARPDCPILCDLAGAPACHRT